MEIVFYIITRIMLVACLFAFVYLSLAPDGNVSDNWDSW